MTLHDNALSYKSPDDHNSNLYLQTVVNNLSFPTSITFDKRGNLHVAESGVSKSQSTIITTSY
jgi:hypothetical protein